MHKARVLANQGVQKIKIAEILKVTDRTVRNYLNGSSPKMGPKKKRVSKLAPFYDSIRSILDEEPNFNLVVIYNRIKKQGYTGKISILRDFARSFRNELQKEVVRRFETEPGYQAQMDWKELPRDPWKGIYAYVLLLGYSRKPYVYFTNNMKSSTFLSVQKQAFEYFGGVPETVLYDNMKTAWNYKDGEWNVQPKLLEMSSLYGFEAKRCRVRRPQTKGKVERFISFLSDRFLPEALLDGLNTIEQLNDAIGPWLDSIGEEELRDFTETRAERFAREKSFLNPIPQDIVFDPRNRSSHIVSREGYISFEGNKYSVPPRFVGKSLELRHDGLNNTAEVIWSGISIRTFDLLPKGAKKRYIWSEDSKALMEIWEQQNTPKTSKPKLMIEEKTQTDVSIRQPEYYDQFEKGVAV